MYESIAGTESSLLVSNLRVGINYKFKVQAENQIGLLSDFSPEQQMRAGQLPTAPGQPLLLSQSSSLISFSWQQPFDNGGTEIDEYELLITSSQGEVSKMITSALQFYFTVGEGLLAGTEYKFKVRARNFYTNYYDEHSLAPWSAQSTFFSSDLPQTVEL